LEPADKTGLASLTGSVLRTGGTTNMSGDALDDFLEGRAASIETGIGTEFGSAGMSCLKDDFPQVLKVFADVLHHPIFEPDKIEVARNQMVSGISRQNDNPQQILFREFGKIIYGKDSPYAATPTYASLGSITRDDLMAWHKKFFHPNRIIIGLAGDFDTAQVLTQIKQVFGDWKKGPAPSKVDIAYNKITHPGVFYIEKNDMTQSNIAMGHLGILRNNPDYYAVEVMNEVFSGGFASRLFSNVRSKKGLAYAVRGGVDSDWDHPGTFQMWMTTKTETTAAGIDALLEEARNITAQPPTEEEVRKAKDAILNSFVFNSAQDSPAADHLRVLRLSPGLAEPLSGWDRTRDHQPGAPGGRQVHPSGSFRHPGRRPEGGSRPAPQRFWRGGGCGHHHSRSPGGEGRGQQ
ncbi:MAG: M16 family metallopeptidase, partial [Acidobacteriota bacterium]